MSLIKSQKCFSLNIEIYDDKKDKSIIDLSNYKEYNFKNEYIKFYNLSLDNLDRLSKLKLINISNKKQIIIQYQKKIKNLNNYKFNFEQKKIDNENIIIMCYGKKYNYYNFRNYIYIIIISNCFVIILNNTIDKNKLTFTDFIELNNKFYSFRENYDIEGIVLSCDILTQFGIDGEIKKSLNVNINGINY